MHDLASVADELAAMGQRLVAVSAQLRAAQQQTSAQSTDAPAAARNAPQPPTSASPVPGPVWPPGWAQPQQWAGPTTAPPQQQWAGQTPGWPGAPAPARAARSGRPGPPDAPKPGLLDREGSGGRLLAWAGGTVTLLGVVLLMVLAVQRGWLGPLPRVIAGAVLGVVMIGLAVRVHRLDGGRTGALALMATGAAALYLDVIAASVLYEFLPVPAGLAVGLVVAAGGLAFADGWREQLLAIMVVAGAALFAPALTGLTTPLLVAFVLVLQIAAAPVQLRRGWSGLAIAGAVPAVMAGLLCAGRAAFDGYTTTTVLAAVAVLVVGATIALLSSALDARLARGVPPVLLAISPAPALLLATQLNRWPGTALALAITVVAAGLWLAWTVRPDLRAVAGVIAAVAGFEATVLAFEGFSLTIALLAQATVLAVVAWRLAASSYTAGSHAAGLLVTSACFLLIGGLQVLAREVPPEVLLRAGPFLDGGRAGLVVALGVSLLLMAAAAAWTFAVNRIVRLGSEAWPLWVLAIGVVLYGEVGAILGTALLIHPIGGGFLAGHAAVTVSWTVVALVLLLRGVRSRALRATGLGLVAAALVKLVAFDLASLDGIARVVTFLGAGLVLLAAGTLYARLIAAFDGEPEGMPVNEG